MLTDKEIDQRIDEIQDALDNVSATCRNALHACRPGHPLGEGQERIILFRNAAFALNRPGVNTEHAVWLNKMANQFLHERDLVKRGDA